jgi:hypothetical protein
VVVVVMVMVVASGGELLPGNCIPWRRHAAAYDFGVRREGRVLARAGHGASTVNWSI